MRRGERDERERFVRPPPLFVAALFCSFFSFQGNKKIVSSLFFFNRHRILFNLSGRRVHACVLPEPCRFGVSHENKRKKREKKKP